MTVTWIPFAFICRHECTYTYKFFILAFISRSRRIVSTDHWPSIVGTELEPCAGEANALHHANATYDLCDRALA